MGRAMPLESFQAVTPMQSPSGVTAAIESGVAPPRRRSSEGPIALDVVEGKTMVALFIEPVGQEEKGLFA